MGLKVKHLGKLLHEMQDTTTRQFACLIQPGLSRGYLAYLARISRLTRSAEVCMSHRRWYGCKDLITAAVSQEPSRCLH